MVLCAQSRIAGYIAPARIQVQQFEPILRPEDFEALEADYRFDESGQPAPGRAPRFDLRRPCPNSTRMSSIRARF
jgi:hypothetical protein